MQPEVAISSTTALPLTAVLGRLAAHPDVDGILLMGSTGTAALTPASDYDLLLVLAALPVPLRLVTTWVDGRLTEAYCTTTAALERIVAAPAPWPDASEEGVVLTWLQAGRIAHDRAGRLAGAQAAARHLPPPVPAGNREVYRAWRKIGYNVAQLTRYLASDDPLAPLVVETRLLYSLFEVLFHYFTVRRLPWRGEKQALRHLADHDPAYVSLLRQCLAEPDRRRKVDQYAELARRTLAPVGGPWEPGTTVVDLGPGYGASADAAPAGTPAEALAFWRRLLAEPSA